MLPPTAIGLNGELMEALLQSECAHISPGDLVQNADCDSVGLRGDMRVCIPGDAALMLWVCRPHSTKKGSARPRSQHSPREHAALTPALLIISFKLTHPMSLKKKKKKSKLQSFCICCHLSSKTSLSDCGKYAISYSSKYLQLENTGPR